MEKILTQSLHNTIHWLIKSKRKSGGSAAYYSPLIGWSKAYPETTGYIVPTLIEYSNLHNSDLAHETAIEFGEWLIEIQSTDGYWNGGLHPAKSDNPSIFNTGQILFGLVSLYHATGDLKWINSAERGANWLANGVGRDGFWSEGHYNNFNPTYYTRVAWPMLKVGSIINDNQINSKAVMVLDGLIKRKNDNGTFNGWAFNEKKPAFTHTIAYTIRGFLESSIILKDWSRYGEKVEGTLEKLYRLSELSNGRLAGAYDLNWKSSSHYTCLTGNVQTAICFMKWHGQNPDLRLLNAASKLIEYVSRTQVDNSAFSGINGAIAGSKPFWGRYLMLRYPNWAAKFYADSIMILSKNIKNEKLN